MADDAGGETGEATTDGGITRRGSDRSPEDTRLAADTDIEAQQQPRTKVCRPCSWTDDLGTHIGFVCSTFSCDQEDLAPACSKNAAVHWQTVLGLL